MKMSRASATPKSNTSASKQTSSLKSKGLKDIRIDEEVKIAVNISLERFQSSDEKGLQNVIEHTATYPLGI